MTRCCNCGAELFRFRSIWRDTEVCENEGCGWWCNAPGTGLTVAAALTAFMSGLFGQTKYGPDPDDLQPA